MGVRFLGIGRQKARLKKRIKQAEAERGASLSGFEDAIEGLNAQAADALNRSELTATDLYGDAITRNTDSVNANANNTKMALSRASAAQGGDVTGSRAVTMDKVDEGANNQVGKINRFYTDRAQTDKEQSLARADRILNSILGAHFGFFQTSDNNFNNSQQLDLYRQQANKQLAADIFSTVADTVTPGGGGGGGPTGGTNPGGNI